MRSTGALLCAVAMTILGSSFAVSGLLLGYPTLAGQAVRYAVAAALLGLLARRSPTRRSLTWPAPVARRPLRPRELVRLGALAATGLAGFNVCVLAALRQTDAAVLGTVVGATPLMLAVLGPVLAGRRPSSRLVASGAVAVAGVALVQGGGHASAAGLVWAAGALAGEVCFSLLAAPLLPALGPVRVSAWACTLAVPQLALASALTGEWRRLRVPAPAESFALTYIAVVLTVVAFVCWYGGLRRLGVERAGMFAGLVPVASLAGAAILDRAAPTPAQLTGTVAVALALVAALRPEAGPAPRGVPATSEAVAAD
jgi:drug/metabolite transporter (DMT)-like permease